jgi:nucleoid DNA-binding protein
VTIRLKTYFDVRVATDMGVPRAQVARITKAFLLNLAEALTDLDEVHLDGLGKFRTKCFNRAVEVRLPKKSRVHIAKRRIMMRQFRVHFQKSRVLCALLRSKHGTSIEEV